MKENSLTFDPKFRCADMLTAPAYYRTCPIRHNNQNLRFKYYHFSTTIDPQQQLASLRTLSEHTLVFQLEGEIHINWDEYKDVVIQPGEMYFLPRGAEVSGYITEDVSMVVAIIGRGMTKKELDDLNAMKEHETFDKYEFKPMVMHPPMLRLAESVREYLTSGVNCSHLHEAKFAELYVVLHWYYSIADNAQLFYPMAGALSDFRNFVLDNYHVTTTIAELVDKANMSRSTFDRKFKETFKTTPLKWIDELIRQTITNRASEPNVTVKDIMYDVGVYNPSQFTKLCRRLCGVTPSELIRSK